MKTQEKTSQRMVNIEKSNVAVVVTLRKGLRPDDKLEISGHMGESKPYLLDYLVTKTKKRQNKC